MAELDVLVLTALGEEFDAAKDVAQGAVDGVRVAQWEHCGSDTSTPYILGTYITEVGLAMNVALAKASRMGASSLAPIAGALVERLRPRCLAMCGVCAGNPSEVALGDVVVAEMTYSYEEGKRTPIAFEGDHRQVPMSETWLRAAQDLSAEDLPSFGNASAEESRLWVLERLFQGDDPRRHPSLARYFVGSDWRRQVERLEAEGMVRRKGSSLVLTRDGRAVVQDILFMDVTGPSTLPFRVRVGPVASGDVVVKDGITWDTLRMLGVRSVLGLELEAATIGSTALRLGVPEWVVAKGVMDHADPRKDDRYKPFAARASAEVLFKLLARQLARLPVTPAEQPVVDAPALSLLANAQRWAGDGVVLIGREGERDSLREILTSEDSDQPSVVSIEGIGGLGKTALATAVSTRLLENCSIEAIAWYSIRQDDGPGRFLGPLEKASLSLEECISAIAAQLQLREVSGSVSKDRSRELILALARHRFLVVVDNAESAEDLGLLAPLLREAHLMRPSRLLVTSRVPVRLYCAARTLELGELTTSQSTMLLRSEAARIGLRRLVEASDESVLEIVSVVGGNPQALHLSLGLLRYAPLEIVVEDLRSARGKRSDEFFRAIYWRAWNDLSPSAQRLLVELRMLSSEGASWERLSAVSGLPIELLGNSLRELVDRYLVVVGGTLEVPLFTIHRLTATFILEVRRSWEVRKRGEELRSLEGSVDRANARYTFERLRHLDSGDSEY